MTNLKIIFTISFRLCYILNDANISLKIWNSLFQLTKNICFIGGDFNAHHPAWGSSFASSCSMIYDYIYSKGICVLNLDAVTYLGRPNHFYSAIDLSFCSSNLSWLFTWNTSIYYLHGSDTFSIIIYLISDCYIISNLPKPHKSINPPNSLSSLKFNFNRADRNSWTELISLNFPS